MSCGICLDQIQIGYRLECQHQFCQSCIVQYVRLKIDDDVLAFPCPDLDCNQFLKPIPPAHLIGQDRTDKLVSGDFQIQCPYMACNHVYFIQSEVYALKGYGQSDSCPSCAGEICCTCFEPFQNNNNSECSSCQGKVDSVQMFFKLKTSKRCPFCKSWITRISGCDEVRCRRCYLTFNWNRSWPPKFYSNLSQRLKESIKKYFGNNPALTDLSHHPLLRHPPRRPDYIQPIPPYQPTRRQTLTLDKDRLISGGIIAAMLLGGIYYFRKYT